MTTDARLALAPWGPLADRHEEIWHILQAIRADIASAEEVADRSWRAVGDGWGAVLLNRYLMMVAPRADRFEERAEEALDQLLATRHPSLLRLYAGTLGVAWLLAHLAALEDDEPEVAEFDDLLGRVLEQPWRMDYDLIGGLVGIGCYLVERLPAETARILLPRVVKQLVAIGDTRLGPRLWFTPPALVPRTQREQYPRGYHNLGMAHGIPGVVWLLSECVRHDIAGDMAGELLHEAVPWLLDQVRYRDGRWCLPSMCETPTDTTAPRLAWCYNELGAMTAVLAAATACDRPAWTDRAATVVEATLGLPLARSGCRDACLCHGSAGIAHLYRWYADWLGDGRFDAEAARWFDITLRMRRPGLGSGGYLFRTYRDGRERDEANHSFLEGGPGIGLALLSATWPVRPRWQRLLGLADAREWGVGRGRSRQTPVSPPGG